MNMNNLDYESSLEAMSPKRLKKGILRMLIISLQNSAQIGMEVEFTSKFYSDLQILFDFLDELKQVRKKAKQSKE
jgi:hypothetical protein